MFVYPYIRVLLYLCYCVFTCFCICNYVSIHLNVFVIVRLCNACVSTCVVGVFVFFYWCLRECVFGRHLRILALDNVLKYYLNLPNVCLINEFDVSVLFFSSRLRLYILK